MTKPPGARIVLAGLLLVTAMTSLVLQGQVAQAATHSDHATRGVSPEHRRLDVSRRQILVLVNRSRQLRGLAPLHLNGRLSREALGHSRKMSRAGAISHTPHLASIIRSVGGTVFGEDVGKGRALHGIRDAWLRRNDTRRILLDGRFDRVGIGVIHVDGFFWVTLQAFD